MQKNEKDVANSCHTISLTRRNVSGPESQNRVYTHYVTRTYLCIETCCKKKKHHESCALAHTHAT